MDRECGDHRLARRVFECEWCPEQSHHAVARELIHGSLVAVHLSEDALKRAVHQSVHVLGAELLGQLRRIREVRKEHGDVFAFALECRLLTQDLFDQVFGRVVTRCGRVLRGGFHELGAAMVAESRRRGVGLRAGAAADFERSSAAVAEPGGIGIQMFARRTVHQGFRQEVRWIVLPGSKATATALESQVTLSLRARSRSLAHPAPIAAERDRAEGSGSSEAPGRAEAPGSSGGS